MGIAVGLALTEISQVGEARRAMAGLALQAGFDETARGNAAIVATEAANNLVKHARDGLFLLRPVETGGVAGVEMLTLDKGPGMTDVSRCLRDGYSTAASPGNGLGAIARLSSLFDIYSTANGTALLARLWARPPAEAEPDRFVCGVVNLPKSGETVCGDAWELEEDGGRAWLLIADGLGHGPFAADAAGAAVRAFRGNARLGPAERLRAIHDASRGTRGSAAAVAEIDLDRQVVRYAGVGNIAGVVLAGADSRSMVSHNGTAGHEARLFQEFTYPFPGGAALVMHSDGLGSRWNLDPYPGLLARDPALIAGVLYRDFQRGRDDATVVVVRAGEGAAR